MANTTERFTKNTAVNVLAKASPPGLVQCWREAYAASYNEHVVQIRLKPEFVTLQTTVIVHAFYLVGPSASLLVFITASMGTHIPSLCFRSK